MGRLTNFLDTWALVSATGIMGLISFTAYSAMTLGGPQGEVIFLFNHYGEGWTEVVVLPLLTVWLLCKTVRELIRFRKETP